MAIFTVLLALAPIAVSKQQQASREKHEQRRQQNASQSDEPSVSITNNATSRYYEHDNEDKPQGWYKFVAWPEGITAWAIMLTLAAIVWQAIETRRSVEAAANAQRSWLVTIGVDKPDLQQAWLNKATIHFKIIGSSPLRMLEANLRYARVASRPDGPNKEPDLPEIPVYENLHDLAEIPSMGHVHTPEDEISVSILLKSIFLKPEDVKAIEDGEQFLCVYGFVRYRDASAAKKRRETRFCFIYGNRGVLGQKGADGFVVGGPPAYNDVMEFKYPAAWKRILNNAMRSFRKAEQDPEEAN